MRNLLLLLLLVFSGSQVSDQSLPTTDFSHEQEVEALLTSHLECHHHHHHHTASLNNGGGVVSFTDPVSGELVWLSRAYKVHVDHPMTLRLQWELRLLVVAIPGDQEVTYTINVYSRRDEKPEYNAFIYSRERVIFISQGFIDELSSRQRQKVLSHEIGHGEAARNIPYFFADSRRMKEQLDNTSLSEAKRMEAAAFLRQGERDADIYGEFLFGRSRLGGYPSDELHPLERMNELMPTTHRDLSPLSTHGPLEKRMQYLKDNFLTRDNHQVPPFSWIQR